MTDSCARPNRLALARWIGAILAVAAPAVQAAETRAAPPASAQLGGHRLQQVALTTADLPRATAFYRDLLGLPLLFESNGMAFFDVAGLRLMIGVDPQRPRGRPTSVLYFDAPDLEATIARLEALGVSFAGPLETVQRGPRGDLKLRQFADPDGNALAVMGVVPRR